MSRLDFVLKQREEYPELIGYSIRTELPKWVSVSRNRHSAIPIDIHKNVFFSEQGFGFQWDGHEHLRIPHIGHLWLGDKVEIFSGTNIVRPTLNDTLIDDGTKIDYNCHIAHNVNIGKHVIITAGCILGGSVTIGDHAYLGIGCIIRNKVKIGKNAIVGMGAVVTKDVPDNAIVYGNPAKIEGYNEMQIP